MHFAWMAVLLVPMSRFLLEVLVQGTCTKPNFTCDISLTSTYPQKWTCHLNGDYFKRKTVFQPAFWRDMFVFAYLLAPSSTVHIYFLINLRWVWCTHCLASVIVMSKWTKTDAHLPCGIGTKIANRRGGGGCTSTRQSGREIATFFPMFLFLTLSE